MVFKSKIKWIAMAVVALSLASLVRHLSIARVSSITAAVDLVHYTAMAAFRDDFSGLSPSRNKNLWAPLKPLLPLQPYSNPRAAAAVPTAADAFFIRASISGGFSHVRSSICDLVVVARLLNATLVIPEIRRATRSKGISSEFKSFSYLYDEDQFIASLINDVVVVKALPPRYVDSKFPTFEPGGFASPSFYTKQVLPELKKFGVIRIVISHGGCLQSRLPSAMSELQRLRCRVAFHALQFRPRLRELGHHMVERLRSWGQPYLAYHPGLKRDILAYHGCAELFQDVHSELIQYRRAQMIKQGIVKEELTVDSHLHRENGSCPLMPEEVGILLRAMGYPPKTIIYMAGSETFGGQRVLIPLRAMFANLVDRTSLCSIAELSDLLGHETPLPPDNFQSPPTKSEQQLKEEWNKAGPRPRPLPPPPDRQIYRHEKEGWYGWITETKTEPDPSLADLRMQAHRLLWDALDYIVSVEADAFFPGFNNDGSGWPDFSSLVMGHRLYEIASSRTYRPDRKVVASLLNMTRDSMYRPKQNWTVQVREHLNKSLGEEGLIRQSLKSKPALFISHPLPECSCRIKSDKDNPTIVRGADGEILYGGEEDCPKWMQHNPDLSSPESVEEEGNEDDKLPDYESNFVDQQPEPSNNGNNNASPVFDQDDEMDPND